MKTPKNTKTAKNLKNTKKSKAKQKAPAILYIEARHKKIPDNEYFIDPNFISRLPKDIFLCYSLFHNKEKMVKIIYIKNENPNKRGMPRNFEERESS